MVASVPKYKWPVVCLLPTSRFNDVAVVALLMALFCKSMFEQRTEAVAAPIVIVLAVLIPAPMAKPVVIAGHSEKAVADVEFTEFTDAAPDTVSDCEEAEPFTTRPLHATPSKVRLPCATGKSTYCPAALVKSVGSKIGTIVGGVQAGGVDIH